MLEANDVDLLMKCEEAFNNLAATGEQAQALQFQHQAGRITASMLKFSVHTDITQPSQSLSKLWFQHRASRITASMLKFAVHTDITQLSQSLIKKICYPESYKFSSQATDWG